MISIKKQIGCLLSLFILPSVLLAQVLTPITRFHEKDSQYTFYNNNLLSGFMQTAAHQSTHSGFLQTPFVGDPLLVYVGEKDSTQFMAYASNYTLHQAPNGTYNADFNRYHVMAELHNMPGYSVQRYTYPDTLADKGFLLDIDNADNGVQNEDMNVVFVDKNTIRAYKRSTQPQSNVPDLYYVAHFSHPFSKWNVRREVVRLANGQREHRCKAAFVFNIKAGESLTITSAVSALSTDVAYAQLPFTGGKRHFNDQRDAQQQVNLLADNNLMAQHTTTSTSTAKNKRVGNRSTNHTKAQPASLAKPTTAPTTLPANNHLVATYSPTPWLELSTRNAELQAAFTAALKQLLQTLPKAKTPHNALAFVDAITPLYWQNDAHSACNAVQTDSLLHHYTQSLFTGKTMTTAQSAWFVMNALGFVPCNDANAASQMFQLKRPLFNVATLSLPRTRRLIIHTKNNTTANYNIKQATIMHHPLNDGLTFSREQLIKGGIIEIKMQH